MRLVRAAAPAASGAIFGALTPIAALLLLAPSQYGQFSIVYLIYAFGVSIQYSVVVDAWSRIRVITLRAPTADAVRTALFDLSALFGAAGMVAAFLIDDLRPLWWAYGVAIFFALFRGGCRYYAVATGQTRKVMASDVAGIVGFMAALLLLLQYGTTAAIAGSWVTSSLASSVLLALPLRARSEGLVTWSRQHWRHIKPLLADSLFMDAGAIGTPFLLAGFMGSTRFGIYRAVSNVALPVRLLIEPIRPRLAQMAPARLFGAAWSMAIAAAALVLTVACYFALALLVPSLPFEVGTLSALSVHALSASLFVAGSLLGTVYYIVCRTNSPGSQIIVGRAAQTGLVIVFPLVGFAVGGLSGAIWGFSLSSLISAGVWLYLARLGTRR